jgi:peptidoglycan-N-acetylglucosamine deacetylase
MRRALWALAAPGAAASLAGLRAIARPDAVTRAAQSVASRAGPNARQRSEWWGFTAPWDPRSAASLAAHGRALGVAVTGWVRLDSITALPAPAYPDTVHVPPGPRRFGMVTTYARDRFHGEVVRQLGADATLRARVAGAIARWAVAGHYRGLVLDFESLTPGDTTALTTVVRTIADSAHRHRIRPVAVAVPPADTLTYGARHLRAADLLLVMLYDEHWATGAPGPIASPDWVRQFLGLWIANAGAARVVASLPVYGYRWRPPGRAAVLSFADAQRLADSAGVPLTRDSASATLHFATPDSAQGWVCDAPLLDTLVRRADSAGVHRIALWRLGLEDPAVWRARRRGG